MANARWLRAADTAKLIRKALKQNFPGVIFSVRSLSYSGGASCDVTWVDGPTTKQVDAVIGMYDGRGFDGMIDLSYYYDAWLLPDGTATIAKCPHLGIDNPAPSPDAELVHFGVGYNGTKRIYSPEFVRRVAAEMTAKTGWEAPPIHEHDAYWSRTKDVPSAYFENWHTQEERETWEEFSQALYMTPGDGPLVTRFDYLDDGNEPEPEPEPPELDKAITEATKKEIAENRAANDRAKAARQAEPEEPQVNPSSLVRELTSEIALVVQEIMDAQPGPFVARCIVRKLGAIEDETDLGVLLQVGTDLALIAAKLAA